MKQMYISIRKYTGKKSDYTGTNTPYYFYLCKSTRDKNGKVANQQYKFCTVIEIDIFTNDDEVLKSKIMSWLGSYKISKKIKLSEEDQKLLWEDVKNKLEKLRIKLLQEKEYYKESYDKRNNKKSNYFDSDEFKKTTDEFENYFKQFSNNKKSNYTEEEKVLFKQMFREMTKIYHPDLTHDDGKKMQLLNKIKNNILS